MPRTLYPTPAGWKPWSELTIAQHNLAISADDIIDPPATEDAWDGREDVWPTDEQMGFH